MTSLPQLTLNVDYLLQLETDEPAVCDGFEFGRRLGWLERWMARVITSTTASFQILGSMKI
jgi:hypothetical protein